uniref:Uncharacterized protein n=1 Tax=Arundo donax TaxID=35708 RepID=A0A0A9EZP7_ARUDO
MYTRRSHNSGFAICVTNESTSGFPVCAIETNPELSLC